MPNINFQDSPTKSTGNEYFGDGTGGLTDWSAALDLEDELDSLNLGLFLFIKFFFYCDQKLLAQYTIATINTYNINNRLPKLKKVIRGLNTISLKHGLNNKYLFVYVPDYKPLGFVYLNLISIPSKAMIIELYSQFLIL